MGIKSLTLQILPWCFPMIDPPTTTPFSPKSIPTVRLISSDGNIQVYTRPIPVSDLMNQFPRHQICHSDSFLIGQKVPSLSADDRLELGHSYFLLPTAFFHSALSFVTAAASLVVMLRPANGKFDIRKTEKGMLQIRISEEMLMDGQDESRDSGFSRVCDTEELEKEYKQLAVGREWEPRLETIEEGNCEIRRKRRLFLFRRVIRGE